MLVVTATSGILYGDASPSLLQRGKRHLREETGEQRKEGKKERRGGKGNGGREEMKEKESGGTRLEVLQEGFARSRKRAEVQVAVRT
jgi:hypothetical protein